METCIRILTESNDLSITVFNWVINVCKLCNTWTCRDGGLLPTAPFLFFSLMAFRPYFPNAQTPALYNRSNYRNAESLIGL